MGIEQIILALRRTQKSNAVKKLNVVRNHLTLNKRSKLLGASLLEVLAAIGIMGGLMVSGSVYLNERVTDIKDQGAAQYQKSVVDASSAYVRNNYATLLGQTNASTAIAVKVSTLKGAGNLPAGFGATNAYGQTPCLLVTQPSAGKLEALIATEGGSVIRDGRLAMIAAQTGSSGGSLAATLSPFKIRGAYGAWEKTSLAPFNTVSCSGTVFGAGSLASSLYFDGSQSAGDYLYRNAVTGDTARNTMNTPLIMNSIQTVGAACTSPGAIAVDSTSAVLSCQSGAWTAGGAKCKSFYGDLNTAEDDAFCLNGASNANSPAGGDWFFMQVYRHINVANFYASQRLVGMTGASVGKVWQRNQQPGTANAGWGAWNQQGDPGVEIAAGEVKAKRGQFSRDGMGPCCGDSGTMSLAEYTAATGKKASISLHNGGYDEGNIELTGPSSSGYGGRRIRFYDNQGQGMGIEATGEISSATNITAGGAISVGANNRIVGNGAQGSYGATAIAGQKNGWTGLEFRDSSGNYQVNQMTNRGSVGYYDAATGRWLNSTDTSGNQTFDQTADFNSGRLNPGWAVETWGCATGQIAKAAYTVADGWAYNGKTLSCQSGVWKASAGFATKLYVCQGCIRWEPAPWISTSPTCNNNYDSGTRICTPLN